MEKSKCFQKYGSEWSKELTETTKNHMATVGAAFVKHITGKSGRIAFTRASGGFERYAKMIPESELSKEVLLLALRDSFPAGMTIRTVFECTYDSIQDMIDDGWAVD